jgi:hypothetical protein
MTGAQPSPRVNRGAAMTVIRLWAVLGGPGVGKSTTVGHLAGDFGRGNNGLRRGRGGGLRDILLRGGGYLTIHPRRQSLQEARKTPDDSVREIANLSARAVRQGGNIHSAHFNVLLALRTDRPGGMPAADDYLSHFVAQDWLIESLALLSPTKRDERVYKLFGAPTCYVYESTALDIGEMVGQVRNHFGWA